MNRTVFSLPAKSEYRTSGGLAVTRVVEQFSGNANRLDELINLLDRRRGVVLSSGTTVPGRYESFDLGFADPPLMLETSGTNFSLSALNARGERVEGLVIRHLPAEEARSFRSRAVDDDTLLAVVHPEGEQGIAALDRLQADQAGAEIAPFVQLGRPETGISEPQ